MSHITQEQLSHLAKLCRIQLTDDDREYLFPQLENIIAFVGQLDEVDVSNIELESGIVHDITSALHEGVVDADFTQKLLMNVQHPIQDQAISVTGKLSEH